MSATLSRLARAPGLPIFLLTLAVYVALVPWLARVWQRSGDEPHYLLAAHSLAHDGDLDLSNNYAQRDYAAFYTDYYLNPHVHIRADGQQVLTHNLGLSFAVAPAYALGGLPGVLYFLALVGALVATNIFLLGYDLTGHWVAAAVGALALAFTPPLLWYVFLVYPELLAGLGLIVAVRIAVAPLLAKDAARPLGLSGVLQFGLGLALLPWLSSRFLPAMGLLLLWGLWQSWQPGKLALRSTAWLAAVALAGAGLVGYMLFSAWLYGSASPAASYAGPIPLAVEQSFALLRIGRGLLGWLFDTQRGLLITAPIYIAALWGAGLLCLRKPLVGALVLLPFGAALLPVAVWGGFWQGWEYSARFLIAALPLLGVGLAYWWAAGRRAVVVPVTAALLAVSVVTGAWVVAQPLRGLISSPVAQWPSLNLAALVPAMARYAFIPAGTGAAVGAAITSDATTTAQGGAVRTTLSATPTWQTAVGESGLVLRQVDLPEFPFGWYSAVLPLVAPDAAPNAAVARISVFSPSGGEYFAATIYARDLPADGLYRFGFHSPLYNGWGFPPTVLVSATGQAALRVGLLAISPDLTHSLGLAALWLVGLMVVGVLVVWGAKQVTEQRLAPRPLLSAALAVVALGSFGWSLLPPTRTIATVEVQRTVGDVMADPAAYRGQTIAANPAEGHEAGKLAYSFPELYAAGVYRLTISAAVLPSDSALAPDTVLATVRAIGTDAALVAQKWVVTAADLPADGQYYTLSYVFVNPAAEGLTFFVDYEAAAGLKLDRFIITPGQ